MPLDSHNFVFVTGLHRSGTSPLHHCLREYPQISGFRDTGVSKQRVAEKNGMRYQKDAEHDGLLFRVYAVHRPRKEAAP